MIDCICYILQNNLIYFKIFGKYFVSVVMVFEVMKYDYEDLYVVKKIYGQDINIFLGNVVDLIDVDQKLQEDVLMFYVVSVNYFYDDKYYVSFSFCRDGLFCLFFDICWGNFWFLFVLWRFFQERFMQLLKLVLSDLKFCVFYGVNGNFFFLYYGYQSIYIMGVFYSGKFFLWESILGNEEFIWEKNYVLNLGLDIGLFSCVNVFLDWYMCIMKDLLMSK